MAPNIVIVGEALKIVQVHIVLFCNADIVYGVASIGLLVRSYCVHTHL